MQINCSMGREPAAADVGVQSWGTCHVIGGIDPENKKPKTIAEGSKFVILDMTFRMIR